MHGGCGRPLVAAHGGLRTTPSSDGAPTKREFRARARRSCRTRARLWDLGVGRGSIGIEWMRASDHAAAIGLSHAPIVAQWLPATLRRSACHRSTSRSRAPDGLADLPRPTPSSSAAVTQEKCGLSAIAEARRAARRAFGDARERDGAAGGARGAFGGELARFSAARRAA
jgi:precorrin-6Y C5,15-methyltransferase (decarboxylating)